MLDKTRKTIPQADGDSPVKNVMVINVSLLRTSREKSGQMDTSEHIYSYDMNGRTEYVNGVQTNEAAVKYVINMLGSSGKRLDRIILLESREVGSAKFSDGEKTFTTHEYFIETIGRYCCESGFEPPEFETIEWKESSVGLLKELVSKCARSEVYIDSTGGDRTQSEWLKLVIRFMEYSGIRIADVLYSSIQRGGSGGGRVASVNTEKLLHLINGAEEFTRTGRCDILCNAFSDREELRCDERISRLLLAMKDFSDNLSICQVEKIGTLAKKIQEYTLDAEKADFQSEEETLFKTLLPLIREKLYLGGDISYLKLIEWCIENDLIQQALTIYESKIPRYVAEKGIFSINEQSREEIETKFRNNGGFSFDLYCWLMYEMIPESRNPEKTLCGQLKDALERRFLADYETRKSFDRRGLNKKVAEALRTVEKLYNDIDRRSINIYDKNALNDIKAIYFGNDKRLVRLIEFIETGKFKSFNAFIGWLNNNEKLLRMLLGFPELSKTTCGRKLSMIRSEWIPADENSSVVLHTSNENMKKIIFDYALIKQIRNTLNHAQDAECTSLDDFAGDVQPALNPELLKINISSIKHIVLSAASFIESL